MKIKSVRLYFSTGDIRDFTLGHGNVTQINVDKEQVKVWLNEKLYGEYYGIPYSAEYVQINK